MLREIRVRRCLTQQQMADKCGISRQRWSQIEAGLSLPPEEVAEELAAFGPIPSALDMFSGQQLRKWFLTAPYPLKLVNRDPWEKALRNWGYWIGKLGVDGRTQQDDGQDGIGVGVGSLRVVSGGGLECPAPDLQSARGRLWAASGGG
ncbi:helix-turn-helix transcriptional regulator [bacterium]|nr:helix-turn-helix transcriptional regulator [bacterium]